MRIDQDLLRRHRRFEQPAEGISEEFLQPQLGLGRTVAVLSRPLGERRSIGWVACHSFGGEQIHLSRLDTIAARALAAAGFPVLRFHGQGYGDSELGMDVVDVASHLRECEDAVRVLKREGGVERVGMMGSRFGGTIAALVAERLDLSFMALWEPVLRGRQFIRDLLRSEVLSEMFVEAPGRGNGDGPAPMQVLQQQLAEQGWVDIKGFPLSSRAHDGISAIDLTTDLTRFSGSSLLVGLTASGKPSAQAQALSRHLESLPGASTFELVRDQFAPLFGQFRWRGVDGGRSKTDIQLELNEKVAAVTVGWAIRQDGPPQAGEATR